MNNISFGANLKIHTSLQSSAKRKKYDILSTPELKKLFSAQTSKYHYTLSLNGFDKRNRNYIVCQLMKNDEVLLEESRKFSVKTFNNVNLLCETFFDMLRKVASLRFDEKRRAAIENLMKDKVIGLNVNEIDALLFKYNDILKKI